jgi:hypothetical protein
VQETGVLLLLLLLLFWQDILDEQREQELETRVESVILKKLSNSTPPS